MRSHRSQIFYNEWTIPGYLGRVRRVNGGFELRVNGRFLRWVYGAPGTKRIADRDILSVHESKGVARLRFDVDDEIIFRSEVLRDVDPGSLQILPEFDSLGSYERVVAMRSRQRLLAPVSWDLGRRGGQAMVRRRIRLRRMAPVILAFVLFGVLLLFR